MMADIDENIVEYLAANGYVMLRRMPDGHIAGVMKFLFTYGLCTRLDFLGYDARWCFECVADATRALLTWNGIGDPPGPWIKQKGPVERCNPLLFDIIGHNSDGSEICRRKAEVDMDAFWPITALPAETPPA